MAKNTVRSCELGQSVAELALMLPVLIVLLLGVVDLGMGFRTYIALTNGAREGARWVSIYPDNPTGGVARAALEAGRIGLTNTGDPSLGVAIQMSPAKTQYSAGENVTFTIRHDYPLLFGLATGLPDVPFRAEATMVVLYDPDWPQPNVTTAGRNLSGNRDTAAKR